MNCEISRGEDGEKMVNDDDDALCFALKSVQLGKCLSMN